MADLISIPVYPAFSADGVRQIIDHNDAKAVFVGKPDNYDSRMTGISSSVQKICIAAYRVNDKSV